MWDNAPLLRGIANALLILSALLMLYGAIHYTVHVPTLFPLESVRLETVPQRVSSEEVLRAARKGIRGNLITVDIEQVRQTMEKLPWVRSVNVRREFPNSLAIHMEEHQALARWNNSMLVNRQGEVFAAETEQELPGFVGPDGTSSEVAARYTQFDEQLAKVDLHMVQISLSNRHAWQLHLNNGVVLELGREDVQERLSRFVKVYPYSLPMEQGKFKYVDLRYRNGFAVGGLVKQG